MRRLLATKPPAPYRLAASEVLRRLGLTIDPATVRRWALHHHLGHPLPKPRPPASARRWQCLKIGALWQLDATPHRWFPGDQRNYPLLDLLDDCSRVCTGATIYHREDLLAYLDFLPTAFTEHGLPLELYVDCHSMFFPQRPDALTQLGAALRFYGVSLRYARTPQAKGKIERQHQYWQGRLPALFAAETITNRQAANILLPPLRRHRNAQEIHREIGRTPRCRSAAGRNVMSRMPYARAPLPMVTLTSGACAPQILVGWQLAACPLVRNESRGRRSSYHQGHSLPAPQWQHHHPRSRTQSQRSPCDPPAYPHLLTPSAFARTHLFAFEILATARGSCVANGGARGHNGL